VYLLVYSRIILLGILIFKGFTARRLYTSFGVKRLTNNGDDNKTGIAVLFTGTKLGKREADQAFPTSAEAQNTQSFISTCDTSFRGICLARS
jgi:hypothetical protein